MVDTPALGAGAARHGGSSPLPRTQFQSFIVGRVAELVDAHGSGPCVRKDMEVRVFSRPQVERSENCGCEERKLLLHSWRL